MDQESVIQSEVSQIEENKYHILMHICMESRKKVLMNLVENRIWIQWGEVRMGLIEKVALTYIPYHV